MLERIVIVGAGRTSESLVQRLSQLAPITVVDKSAAALDELIGAGATANGGTAASSGPLQHEITKLNADGTSRLVLEDARGRAERHVALVAATGDDRTNLEVCRLGSELDFKPVIAIAIDPTASARYESLGARAIVRATLLGDVVERAMRYDGIAVASNLGLGKGDLIEVRILSSSPAIGQPLARLDPEGWRVAAIYRGAELVMPTGKTTIEAEDRVLLVGDPAILPHVAEKLRVGVPDFPLRFGPHVVAYLPRGVGGSVDLEAQALATRTHARGLVRLYPGAIPGRVSQELAATGPAAEPPEAPTRWLEDAPLEGPTLEQHARLLLEHKPGVVVTEAVPRTVMDRLLGRGGRGGALCNLLPVPVLFARGEPEYTRVVHVLLPELSQLPVVDMAIDLARLLGLPLALVHVDLPAFVGGVPDARAEQSLAAAQRRAQLYRLAATTMRLEGNPVAEIVRSVDATDLVVVARRRTHRDSFAAPDVALRIAQDAPCSTLVWTAS